VTRPSSRLLAASTSSSSTNNGSDPNIPPTLFAPDAPSAAAARQELFNSISPVYDELNDRLSFGMHRVWKRMAVRWALRGDGGAARIVAAESSGRAQPQPPRRALDVCCGSGDLALLLADALEVEWGRYGGSGPRSSSSSSPLEVVGLDFAAEMLADASRRERRERKRPLVADQQNAGNGRPSSSSSSTPQQRAQIQWVQGDATKLPFSDASFGAATVGYGLRNVADQPAALRELARVLSPGGHLAVLDFNNAKGSGDWIADAAQGFFLERVVVPEAEKFGLREQYAYLRPSVHSYPSGEGLERMAREAGFRYARHYPLAFGMMGCLVATR
jgi:demethylmenaquinone methyltransferase/2-methoxy-6-polyprenyl-1,4-benzoquinol methylase